MNDVNPTPDGAPAPPGNAAAENARLKIELATLKNQLHELETGTLPEAERLKRELKTIAAERDDASRELSGMRRRRDLETLAQRHGFNDVDYLDFLLAKREIAPDDAAACTDYLQTLAIEAPRFFNVALKPGAGSHPDARRTPATAGSGAGGIAAMLETAPEIH